MAVSVKCKMSQTFGPEDFGFLMLKTRFVDHKEAARKRTRGPDGTEIGREESLGVYLRWRIGLLVLVWLCEKKKYK